MKEFKAKIEFRDPEKLTPYVQNAKKHPQDQIDMLASMIAKFGFDQPIVVDGDGVIIKGHGRRAAALQLELKAVPIIVRTDMSEAEMLASRIADNKSNETDWDFGNLKIDFLSLKEFDFDLGLTGFSSEEIESAINGWSTDFNSVEKSGENIDGITSVIKVCCPQEMKQEVSLYLQQKIDESGFQGVEIE